MKIVKMKCSMCLKHESVFIFKLNRKYKGNSTEFKK